MSAVVRDRIDVDGPPRYSMIRLVDSAGEVEYYTLSGNGAYPRRDIVTKAEWDALEARARLVADGPRRRGRHPKVRLRLNVEEQSEWEP